MGVVLFVTQYFYPQSPQTTIKPVKQATPQQAQTPPAPSKPATPQTTPPAGQIAATTRDLHTIQTDLYKVVFSNHGAVVRSWELMKYRDGAGKPLELVNTIGAPKTHYPFSLVFENQSFLGRFEPGAVCRPSDCRRSWHRL